MKEADKARRTFLQMTSGVVAGPRALMLSGALPAGTMAANAHPLVFGDAAITLEFDQALRSRVLPGSGAPSGLHTNWSAAQFLRLADGRRIDRFVLKDAVREPVLGVHGKGSRLVLTGTSSPGIDQTLEVQVFDRYPGVVLLHAAYRNVSDRPLALSGWTSAAYRCPMPHGSSPRYWTYSGSTYSDRRDWLQPVTPAFSQRNFQGMTSSDYGGGTPVVDLWSRDGGIAIGHVEVLPRIVSLPVQAGGGAVSVALCGEQELLLQPGASFQTPQTFVAAHRGDYFAALDSYRRIMADRGVVSPEPPAAAYEPIWCAWGYERQCTSELIEGTLAKARDLGLDWAVIDDGWQSVIGDWRPDPKKYPQGGADMKRLVGRIRAQGLKARLWFSPLSVAPGSDALHDDTDMLLLDKDGAPQNITWWNSFALCPAYARTQERTQDLVRRFIGEWGFSGLKLDGQHLNGVAPCFNPAHRHARPEESVEGLHDFYRAIYDTARQIEPEAVVELCPCGTSYSIYNFPYMNQAPASDPESSWQVRHKGKTLKALMGPSAAYAGDHVELSEHGDDFASTVGVGAIVSTKFTWPVDPKPKDSFLLTPQKEEQWRKWIAVARDKQLPRGTYRGTLYDIAFDKPETHVVERAGRLYYAFYAPRWKGPVAFRGLASGQYRLFDYVAERALGTVSQARDTLALEFEHYLLVEAVPA